MEESAKKYFKKAIENIEVAANNVEMNAKWELKFLHKELRKLKRFYEKVVTK